MRCLHQRPQPGLAAEIVQDVAVHDAQQDGPPSPGGGGGW